MKMNPFCHLFDRELYQKGHYFCSFFFNYLKFPGRLLSAGISSFIHVWLDNVTLNRFNGIDRNNVGFILTIFTFFNLRK